MDKNNFVTHTKKMSRPKGNANISTGDSMISKDSQKQLVSVIKKIDKVSCLKAVETDDTVNYQLWAYGIVNMSLIILSKNRAEALYVDERVFPLTVPLQ